MRRAPRSSRPKVIERRLTLVFSKRVPVGPCLACVSDTISDRLYKQAYHRVFSVQHKGLSLFPGVFNSEQ